MSEPTQAEAPAPSGPTVPVVAPTGMAAPAGVGSGGSDGSAPLVSTPPRPATGRPNRAPKPTRRAKAAKPTPTATPNGVTADGPAPSSPKPAKTRKPPPARKKAVTRGKAVKKGGRPAGSAPATTGAPTSAPAGAPAPGAGAVATGAALTTTGTAPTGPTATTRRVGRAGHVRRQPKWVERLFAPPNIAGPRVRLGILWFALAAPAAWFGPVPTAALFGLHALVAALQSGQAWRRAGYRPSRIVAAPAALAMPLLAIRSVAAPGLVVLALPVVALIAALLVPRARRRTSAVIAASTTLRCAVPAGVAAAGMVYLASIGPGQALIFVLLVSAYDLGSFLAGAETPSPIPGIFIGAVTTLSVTLAIFVLSVIAIEVPPFEGTVAAWIFGGMVAVFAPLGHIVASLSLPTATTWVPALRRLDAYILTAPLWAWLLWHYLA